MGVVKKSSNDPSKVILFRNIPDEFQETQVLGLCEPFGQVTHSILSRTKRRALVEFLSVRMAMQCNSFFEKEPCVVGGNQISIGFSAKKEIGKANPANRVVELEITNIKYPLTVDVVAEIFKPFLVRKIAYKEEEENRKCTAIVELGDVESATAAFYKLQNRNIYADCNTVRVKYSALKEVVDSDPDVSLVNFQNVKRVALTHPVCILHGLHETLTKPEELAAIFQSYGTVVRIKIMYNNRAICLVQMESIEDCHRCIRHLNGFVLHGRRINVEPSKGKPIPPPMPITTSTKLVDQERLTVDFGEYGNAYKGPKTRTHIHPSGPPSSLLYVAQPGEEYKDEILKTLNEVLFVRCEAKVQNLKYPVLEFADVMTATCALTMCHGMETGAGPLHLSFT